MHLTYSNNSIKGPFLSKSKVDRIKASTKQTISTHKQKPTPTKKVHLKVHIISSANTLVIDLNVSLFH